VGSIARYVVILIGSGAAHGNLVGKAALFKKLLGLLSKLM